MAASPTGNPWRGRYTWIQLPAGRVHRVRVCPACGRHYATLPDEARAVACCGREVPFDPGYTVPPGTAIYYPWPDQFADKPAIVEGASNG